MKCPPSLLVSCCVFIINFKYFFTGLKCSPSLPMSSVVFIRNCFLNFVIKCWAGLIEWKQYICWTYSRKNKLILMHYKQLLQKFSQYIRYLWHLQSQWYPAYEMMKTTFYSDLKNGYLWLNLKRYLVKLVNVKFIYEHQGL